MADARVILASELAPQPWKNGQGTTWEIAADPPGAGIADFRWRVSRARIDADCAFSLFPGCERWTVCIAGAGFTLDFTDGQQLAVPPMSIVRFSGDLPAECRLANGPCTDINVIARRDQLRTEVELIQAPERLPMEPGSALMEAAEVLVRLNATGALRAVFRPH